MFVYLFHGCLENKILLLEEVVFDTRDWQLPCDLGRLQASLGVGVTLSWLRRAPDPHPP